MISWTQKKESSIKVGDWDGGTILKTKIRFRCDLGIGFWYLVVCVELCLCLQRSPCRCQKCARRTWELPSTLVPNIRVFWEITVFDTRSAVLRVPSQFSSNKKMISVFFFFLFSLESISVCFFYLKKINKCFNL